jgi:hypothetical protein
MTVNAGVEQLVNIKFAIFLIVSLGTTTTTSPRPDEATNDDKGGACSRPTGRQEPAVPAPASLPLLQDMSDGGFPKIRRSSSRRDDKQPVEATTISLLRRGCSFIIS